MRTRRMNPPFSAEELAKEIERNGLLATAKWLRSAVGLPVILEASVRPSAGLASRSRVGWHGAAHVCFHRGHPREPKHLRSRAKNYE
jgi:hypothetical protein